VVKWVREVKGKTKPLMLFGPTGSGKTALANAIALEMNWNLVQFDAFDFYDEDKLKSALSSVSQKGLFGRNLTVIDNVNEEVEGKLITKIAEVTRKAVEPLILILDNPWTQKFIGLRLGCRMVELKKINSADIKSILNKISESEGVEMKIENFTGDLRGHINDLQVQGNDNRNRTLVIFDAVRKVFNSTLSECLKAVDNSGMDLDFFIRWVEENIPSEFEDKKEVAKAFDWLSKGDVFNGNKSKGLTLYYKIVSIGGVNTSRMNNYHKFVRYSFPEVIKKLSETKKKRELMKKISIKIASKFHCSSKYARRSVFPYLSKVEGFREYFEIQSFESL
jgi:replication factor C large subunit